jgi:hypothetical protein
MTRLTHDALTGETRLDYVHEPLTETELFARYMAPAAAAIAERVERDLLAMYAAFKISQ